MSSVVVVNVAQLWGRLVYYYHIELMYENPRLAESNLIRLICTWTQGWDNRQILGRKVAFFLFLAPCGGLYTCRVNLLTLQGTV